jgi:fructuronate reductase
MTARLSETTLKGLEASDRVRLPRRDRASRTGIVHLGIGAFHRAHQAVFTEDAMEATGDDAWGICGVTQRSRTVVDQLAPQDGLYGVLERGRERTSLRVVSAVTEVLAGGEEPETVRARIGDPETSVVTLTVTEKGYRVDGSAVGHLVAGLRERQRHDAPLTVVSCDNLVGNGHVLGDLVRQACQASPDGEALASWVAENVAFPCSMVDRIVPATTPEDRAEAEALLGLSDAGLVVAEPFRQWVIEDRFAGPRPAWERAGATLTDDVAPYEDVKLRLLNATHSLLAYTGALAGYDTIAEAVADERLGDAARRLMAEDAAPTLRIPDGLDAEAYQREVLERFANPALRHRTTQVAMDGSQKLPMRLLPTLRDRLRAGGEPRWAALAVAAWMVYVGRGTDSAGRPLPLDDPLADRLRSVAADGEGPALVDNLLGVREVFDAELASSQTLRALLTEHVEALSARS